MKYTRRPYEGWGNTMNESMSAAYQAAADDGMEKMMAWIEANNITELPEDIWTLPKDCPLWSLGLSMAQASWIVGACRRRLSEQQKQS